MSSTYKLKSAAFWKMKGNLFLLALCLLLSNLCQAQLRVYHISGEAYRQEKTGPHRLRFRDEVLPGQRLELKAGCQLVLVDGQGASIAYAKPGRVTYTELQQALRASEAGTRSYLRYVWLKMNSLPVASAQQGNRPIGGVSRGDQPLLWAPADSVVLEQPEITFQWISDEAPFYFTVTDQAGTPLLRLKTPASTLSLNLLASRLVRNTVYYWAVSSASGAAGNVPRHCFLWPDDTLQRQFEQQLPNLNVGRPTVLEQQWQQEFKSAWFFSHLAAKP